MFWDVTRGVCETPSSDAIQMIPLCLQAIHVVSRIMISMFNEFCASIQLKDDKLLNSKSMLLFSFCFRFIQIPWIFLEYFRTIFSVDASLNLAVTVLSDSLLCALPSTMKYEHSMQIGEDLWHCLWASLPALVHPLPTLLHWTTSSLSSPAQATISRESENKTPNLPG